MSQIDQNDIRAAVGSGLISEAQAASLLAMSHSRRGAREDLSPGDEPFELFKGFNEIFIVIGMLILASGWAAVTAAYIAGSLGGYVEKTIGSSALGAVLLWIFAEYFIRRRRMIAPAIALSLLWAANAGTGMTAFFSEPFMVAQNDLSSLPLPMALTTAAVPSFQELT